ncbi:MAG: hypothetical protein IIT46_11420 [Lachnospiraceae bacterium]|nr:hypothetical protein [Lachnospiraceae bacterium]
MIDYFSGVIAAYITNCLSSRVGFIGHAQDRLQHQTVASRTQRAESSGLDGQRSTAENKERIDSSCRGPRRIPGDLQHR